MLSLDFSGADTFVIESDASTFRFLLTTYRNENAIYCARYQQETQQFFVHFLYLNAHLALFRSRRFQEANAASGDPSWSCSDLLKSEIEIWDARQEFLAAIDGLLIPDPKLFGTGEGPLLVPLRGYQTIGAAWMIHRENGLLADEVGVGKTPTTLAYCLSMMQEELAESVLIVAPKSLVGQWATEIQKFVPAPLNDLIVVSGEKSLRKKQWTSSVPFLIATYERVRIDLEMIREIPFEILIADEAGKIKQRDAQITHAMKQLRSRYRFALTATPIENQLSDLFSIYEWIHPGILGNRAAFQKSYAPQSERESELFYRPSAIKTHLVPILQKTCLRRTKRQVLPQLPPVVQTRLLVDLEGLQRDLYETMEAETKEAVEMLIAARGYIDRLLLISKLIYLRQLANDPEQFAPEYAGTPSAKGEALIELLGTALCGKVLIFTQFEVMAHLLGRAIETAIAQRAIPHDACRVVTGRAGGPEREAIKTEFNQSDRPRVLVSTDCMKYGANLQAAQAVVNYDLPWNDAGRQQRIGRAHRLGMEGVERLGVGESVLVYDLIAKDTVEERIEALLATKKAIFEMALTDEKVILGLTNEDLRSLLP